MTRFLPLLLLTACATSPLAPPTVEIRQVCLPLTPYSAAQEKALAGELRAFKPDDPALLFITDYGAMRAADRACLASVKP